MNVSITGGTGCLGQPIINSLLNANVNVKVLVLPQDTLPDKFKKNVQIIQGDLNSTDTLENLSQNADTIFHLAGKVHSVPKSESEEKEFYKINAEGTKNLLSAAKKHNVKRIIFFSTVGVYGKDSDFHGDEKSPCNPLSDYAKSKLMAEKMVLESSKNDGPEGVVLRFPVVYGPLDRGNVSKLIKAVHSRLFFYFGDGSCLRSMISSKNVAEAAIKAAFEPKAANEVFCVTDGRDYTMNEFVDSICRALGIRWRPFHVPISLADLAGRFGDVLRKWAHVPFPIDSDRVRKLSRPLTFSCEKAKRVLGYKPVEMLEEGIKKEVQWLYPKITQITQKK